MKYYIGLDVSQRETAICVVNGSGRTVAEGRALFNQIEIVLPWGPYKIPEYLFRRLRYVERVLSG
jgi:hypothetical protein